MKEANEVKSGLRFLDYIVDAVEFYTNSEYEENGSVKVDFKIGHDISYYEDNNMSVTLKVKVFENAVENNYPFSMNINVTGFFQVDSFDLDKKSIFAETNAIAILFPYIRAMITTYSANANVAPLILPPINVVKMLQGRQ